MKLLLMEYVVVLNWDYPKKTSQNCLNEKWLICVIGKSIILSTLSAQSADSADSVCSVSHYCTSQASADSADSEVLS